MKVSSEGKESRVEIAYVRGSQITFLILPSMLQRAPFFNRIKLWRKFKGNAVYGANTAAFAMQPRGGGFGRGGRGGGRGGDRDGGGRGGGGYGGNNSYMGMGGPGAPPMGGPRPPYYGAPSTYGPGAGMAPRSAYGPPPTSNPPSYRY